MKKIIAGLSVLMLSSCLQAGSYSILPQRNGLFEAWNSYAIDFYDTELQLVKTEYITEREFEPNKILSAYVGYSVADLKTYRKDFYKAEYVRPAMNGSLSSASIPVLYKKNEKLQVIGESWVDGERMMLLPTKEKDIVILINGDGVPYHKMGKIQNKRLVLRADVSEKHYTALPTIQSANFKTPYDNQVYALSELSGKLLSTGKSAETNTFFIPVTFEFNNQGNVIPGSFVEIYLLSSPLENVISIPVSALTNEMGHFYVYKQLDEEGYQKQEVKTGANNGKSVQILSGLTAGDHVVTLGAYQVKMASASAAIPGHSHEH